MRIMINPQKFDYYYEMTTLCLVSGYRYAMLDGMKKFELKAEPIATGLDVLVVAEDLYKLFAPYVTYEEQGEIVVYRLGSDTVSVRVDSRDLDKNGESIIIADAPRRIDGTIFVPAGQVMEKGFGKTFRSSKMPDLAIDPMKWPVENTLIAISNDPTLKGVDSFALPIHIHMRGKQKPYGVQRRSYWMEAAKKIIPYNLYIPSKYDPNKPSKLVLALHGGRKNEEYIFEATDYQIAYYCEEYNYILLATNAVVVDGTYGSLIGNYQFTELTPGVDRENKENPLGYTEEMKKLMYLSERGPLDALEIVMKEWNIDKEHIYMLGNSMGGIGTFHFAALNPTMFRAIAPCGGCPHMGYYDAKKLGDLPILFTYGSEDNWGADILDEAVEIMQEAGCNLKVHIIGGGVHTNSWVIGLPDIFKFFESEN